MTLDMTRALLIAFLCSAALEAAAWSPCNLDRDCSKGWVCATKGPNAGRCELSPRTPVPIGGDMALPRRDRDPSSVPHRTPDNQFTSLQCASDRDCPDGFACTRRSTHERWYCRRR